MIEVLPNILNPNRKNGMIMFRLFLLFIVFYIVYKAVKIFFRYFSPSLKRNSKVKNNLSKESKYKDVEEVKFTEIKSEIKSKTKKKD